MQARFFIRVNTPMPPLSSDVFWAAVAASRLIADEQLPQIRAACEADTKAADESVDKQTALAAQWLVRRGALTLWQAKRLTRGGGGSFFIGDYRLLDKHEPSFGGVVYRAVHGPTQRRVALVPLERAACERVEVWTEVMRRTERAAEATDPALSRTWALEEASSGRFIVCEDIPGHSLTEELAQRGGWPVAEAVQMLLPLCRAVGELHRLGGVHGLIATGNVIRPASKEDHQQPLRLLQHPLAGDPLGLLSADPLRQSRSLLRLGEAVCFVSPERLTTGQPETPAGDVYALGCLLHTLLTGRLVTWQGDPVKTAAFLRQAVATATPILPSIPHCPAEVEQLIAYLTASNPARRYADAAEAADAIAACLGQPAVSPSLPAARPPVANLIAAAAAASTEQPAPKLSQRQTWLPVVAGGVTAAVVVLIGMAALFIRWGTSATVPGDAVEVALAESKSADESKPSAEADGGNAAPDPSDRFLVESDDQLPWLPPTAGSQPSLRYLPAGSQLMLLARPAELLATADGRLLLQAGDAALARAVAELERLLGQPLAEIEQLQIGWQADADGLPLLGIWARGLKPAVADSESSAADGTAAVEQVGSWARWRPPAGAGREVVVASSSLLEPLMAAADASGQLPRSMRPLLSVLDDQRQLTLFGSPHYFVHDGRSLLPPAMLPLLDPLEQLVGADCPAAAVSLHLDDRTYVELDAVSPAVGSARGLERQVEQRLTALADAVEEVISQRNLAAYGKRLVLRLPSLVRLFERQLRVGIEHRDLIVANAYLPQFSGHNIAAAATVLLEQIAADPEGEASIPATASAKPPETLAQRLQRPVSIAFAKDTLETAVQMLAEESGIPIEIAGPDLELEGITKNQSFGLEQRGVPADVVLLTILQKSDGGADKLVYVVRQQGGQEQIVVTTRKAAEKRGESLPDAFTASDAPVSAAD
jgi:hypothetical protein